MFDINNLNFKVLSREDDPNLKGVKNKNKMHYVMFDYDTPENKDGLLLRVTSVLRDKSGNAYNRYEDILVLPEQTHYVEINDNIIAELIQIVIKKHGYDLGLPENLVKLPTIKQIENFIDSL